MLNDDRSRVYSLSKSVVLYMFISVFTALSGCSYLAESYLPKKPKKAKPYKKRPLNDVQKDYWDVAFFNKAEGWQWEKYRSYSHYECIPKSTLKKYASKPLSCFDKQNELCPIYKDALVGNMPEDVLTLFLDATEVENNPVDKACL